MVPDALVALSGEQRRLDVMLRLEVAPTPDGFEVRGALTAGCIDTDLPAG
jgi:hypothetical protein